MVDCGHNHAQHDYAQKGATRRLIYAFAVIFTFMVVEVIGGVLSGSLALLADAAHMMTDAFALALAISAQFFAAKPADGRLHFGYRRAQVLAAFVNGILLAILLCWIVVEAVSRFANPIPIDAPLMLWIAVAGLVANAVAFAILHRPKERDLNMRGAMLHVLGDLLGSVAAIIAALVVISTGWTRIDPILSVLVAVLIGISAVRLIRDAGFILLEGAPDSIDIDALSAGVREESPLIKDVHHVRISQITPDQLRLTMHVCVDHDGDAPEALAAAKHYLERRHNIRESTIQVETGDCLDRAERPAMPPASPATGGEGLGTQGLSGRPATLGASE